MHYRFIDISEEIIVYGYSAERLTTRKTCVINFQLTERNNLVFIELSAKPFSIGETNCLHRDQFKIPLEAERSMVTMKRDFLLFENIKAIESTLTKAIFMEKNAEGTWTVSQDDIYASYCKNKSFFILETSRKSGKAPAS